MEEIAQPEWYKSIFQLYGQEYPLRSNSLLAKNDIFSEYVEKFESSTKFSRGEIVDNKSQVIPYLCENQKKTNFQVRVPMGKALIPLRMVQITEFLYKYMQAQKDILSAQYTCTPEYSSTGTGGSQGSVVGSGVLSKALLNAGSTSFFGASNKLAQRIMGITSSNSSNTTMKGKKNSLNVRESSGDIEVGDVSFVSARKERAIKNKKLIDLAESKRNDKLIGKYSDSLSKTYGSALGSSKQSVFGKLGNTFLSSGIKSNSNTIDSTKSGTNAFSGNAKGVSVYTGGEGAKTNTGGAGFARSNGKSSYSNTRSSSNPSALNQASGGLSNSDKSNILNNVGNSEYDPDGDDTLFDIITKRYIKSAYPQFMSPNTKKEID